MESITRADAIALLEDVAKVAPVGVNRVRALLSKVFNWALDVDLVDVTPMVRVKAPAKESKRDRTLTPAEIAEVWAASHDVGLPFGHLIRVLLLTGQRRTQAATMRRQDLDAKAMVWIVPREAMKGGRPHLVPILPAVAKELAALAEVNSGEYLFSTTNGERPFSGYSKAKAALDGVIQARRAKAGVRVPIAPWTLHDARRTCGTGMAALGVSDEHRKRVLGQAQDRLDSVYNVHDFAKEKRRALERWTARVLSLVEPQRDNNVVVITRARGDD